jgi:hypothetical protein
MEGCVKYLVSASKSVNLELEGEIPLDLGYRWEVGVTDWEVLSELTGEPVKVLQNILSEMTGDDQEAAYAWLDAGQTFDWLLGGDVPYFVEKELYKL